MQQSIQLNNVRDITKKLRRKLIEYRFSKKDVAVSTHVNAVEMAVCLVEIVLEIPSRAISREEESWFRAGYHLSFVFPTGSEWYDIYELYDKLVDEVGKLHYFRV